MLPNPTMVTDDINIAEESNFTRETSVAINATPL